MPEIAGQLFLTYFVNAPGLANQTNARRPEHALASPPACPTKAADPILPPYYAEANGEKLAASIPGGSSHWCRYVAELSTGCQTGRWAKVCVRVLPSGWMATATDPNILGWPANLATSSPRRLRDYRQVRRAQPIAPGWAVLPKTLVGGDRESDQPISASQKSARWLAKIPTEAASWKGAAVQTTAPFAVQAALTRLSIWMPGSQAPRRPTPVTNDWKSSLTAAGPSGFAGISVSIYHGCFAALASGAPRWPLFRPQAGREADEAVIGRWIITRGAWRLALPRLQQCAAGGGCHATAGWFAGLPQGGGVRLATTHRSAKLLVSVPGDKGC